MTSHLPRVAMLMHSSHLAFHLLARWRVSRYVLFPLCSSRSTRAVLVGRFFAGVAACCTPAVAARAEPPVATPYEMFGNPMFGCTHGDLNDDRATKQTFTVMRTGRLDQILFQTQGSRHNRRWGDHHSEGTGGSYRIRVYQPSAPGAVASAGGTPDGDPQGTMTLLGSTRSDWFPGRVLGGFDRDFWPSTENQQVSDAVHRYVGGTWVQSWFVRQGVGYDNRTNDGNDPPAGFVGTVRAEVNGIVYVDICDVAGEPGIAVKQGQVLCISHENQDASPHINFSHNNEAHSCYAPVPGTGSPTPLDSNAGVYFNNGERDWRKMPHFGVRIDGTWYGQPFYMVDGLNTEVDEAHPNGAARLLYGARHARQILTPAAGYSRTMNTLWVHAVRWTGKTGYVEDGCLQARILRAPLGSVAWTQAWPETGWSTFPAGSFGAHARVISGGKIAHRQLTTTDERAKIATYGQLPLHPSLSICGQYHYAVELRVAPDSPRTAFYIQAVYTPSRLYGQDIPPSQTVNVLDRYPALLPWGNSGRSYNCAETSDDGGRTWSPFGAACRSYPVALQPDPL